MIKVANNNLCLPSILNNKIVGGKTFTAEKGATIFAPRGIPHTYRYIGQTPGRLMCVITPSGFEGFFEEIGAMSPR